MTDRLAFSVPGPPRGKDRARVRARLVWRDGQPLAVSTVYSDPAMERAERAVLQAFRLRYPGHEPWAGAVMLRFTAVFEVPASWPRRFHEAAQRGELYHTSKPDKDNVEKLVVDALKGFAWADDAQVQGGGVKRYGAPARVDIVLEALPYPADLPPTPSIKSAQQRLDAGPVAKPPRGRGAKATNAKSNPRLAAAIDAALAKEKAGGR